jgi:hypothetical protein
MLCKRRRIKPTQKYTSMGMTTIEHISEGMCRQCAWERIKHKCKMCAEVIGKGYPRLIAHITSHYTSNELLYNEAYLPESEASNKYRDAANLTHPHTVRYLKRLVDEGCSF